MTLQEMRASLDTELRARRHRPLFENAKRSRPVLAEFPSIVEALDALESHSVASYDEKESVLRALMHEQQQRPCPFWNAVLVVACYPMLVRLVRIPDTPFPPDELPQVLVATFLDVVTQFPLTATRDRTFLHLRQATRRRLFDAIRAQRKQLGAVCLDDPAKLRGRHEQVEANQRGRLWPDTAPSDSPQAFDYAEMGSLVSFLSRHGAPVLDDDKLSLVIATTIRKEPLTAYVNRLYADLPEAGRAQVYQRVKRRHSRALEGLRHALARKLPRNEKNMHDFLSPN